MCFISRYIILKKVFKKIKNKNKIRKKSIFLVEYKLSVHF